MKLHPFRFTAFIGLLLTVAVVLVACPTHVNQAPFASQFSDVTMAATSIVASDAVELQWIAGSDSMANNEWLNRVIDVPNKGTVDCPPKNLGTRAWIHNEQIVADPALQVPSTDWVWDDLRQAAKTLNRNDTNVYSPGTQQAIDFAVNPVQDRHVHVGSSAW